MTLGEAEHASLLSKGEREQMEIHKSQGLDPLAAAIQHGASGSREPRNVSHFL